MREFFKGWRRKLGCVCLVMACVMMGMWQRSRVYGDFLRLTPGGSSNQFITSFQGDMKWIAATDPSGTAWPAPRYRVSMIERYPTDETLMPIYGGGSDYVWNWQWKRFGFVMGAGTAASHQFSIVLIPYWSLVLTLTFVSALLILWKPRQRELAAPQSQEGIGT